MLLLKPIKLIATLLIISSLTSCGLLPEAEDETRGWSAKRLYTEAKEYLNDGDYTIAVQYYEILQSRYPFGRYAQQAQLDTLYAYYKTDEPESAFAAADRFIKLYPRHPHIDYVYYIKGLVNFELDVGFLDRFLAVDKSQRDQGAALNAFNDFAELVERYPYSKYAEDSRKRMLFLRNNLAAYELHVARYYIKRGAYVAAVNRAKKVIEAYQKTPSMPEALTILAKGYRILGKEKLAADALRVLETNYPNYEGIEKVKRLQIVPQS